MSETERQARRLPAILTRGRPCASQQSSRVAGHAPPSNSPSSSRSVLVGPRQAHQRIPCLTTSPHYRPTHLLMQRMEGLSDGQVDVDHNDLATLGDELVGRVAMQKVTNLLTRVLLCPAGGNALIQGTMAEWIGCNEKNNNQILFAHQRASYAIVSRPSCLSHYPHITSPPPRLTGSLGLWITMGATTASALAMSTSWDAWAAVTDGIDPIGDEDKLAPPPGMLIMAAAAGCCKCGIEPAPCWSCCCCCCRCCCNRACCCNCCAASCASNGALSMMVQHIVRHCNTWVVKSGMSCMRS